MSPERAPDYNTGYSPLHVQVKNKKPCKGRNIFYFKAKICVICAITKISSSDKVEGGPESP